MLASYRSHGREGDGHLVAGVATALFEANQVAHLCEEMFCFWAEAAYVRQFETCVTSSSGLWSKEPGYDRLAPGQKPVMKSSLAHSARAIIAREVAVSDACCSGDMACNSRATETVNEPVFEVIWSTSRNTRQTKQSFSRLRNLTFETCEAEKLMENI